MCGARARGQRRCLILQISVHHFPVFPKPLKGVSTARSQLISGLTDEMLWALIYTRHVPCPFKTGCPRETDRSRAAVRAAREKQLRGLDLQSAIAQNAENQFILIFKRAENSRIIKTRGPTQLFFSLACSLSSERAWWACAAFMRPARSAGAGGEKKGRAASSYARFR